MNERDTKRLCERKRISNTRKIEMKDKKEKIVKRITASSEWKKEWRDKLKNEWIPVNVRINEWKLKKI